jgi:RimJ/RimL family protein N-acetyltransferase
MTGWKVPLPPDTTPMLGRYCRLEPLDVAMHMAPMHDALLDDKEGSMWTYTGIYELRGEMTSPPSLAQVQRWLTAAVEHSKCFVIIAPSISDQPLGTVAFESIQPEMGSVAIGFVAHAPALRGTAAATEAHWLMLRRAFETGYRRVEWSCDALNTASRQAAVRLGYKFEGVLRYTRQKPASVELPLSGNAYFSILDFEWPALSAALEQWLRPANFDSAGRQHLRLSDLTAAARQKHQQQQQQQQQQQPQQQPKL